MAVGGVVSMFSARYAKNALERGDGVVAGCCGGKNVGRSLHQRGQQPLMRRGFDVEAEQNQGKARETMLALFSFLGGQAQQHRQVGDRARGEFLFVEREQMREVARSGSRFGAEVR